LGTKGHAFHLDHFTEDAVYHAMPLRPVVGKAALAPWIQSFESVPPGRLEIRHQVATENVVINERVDRITVDGALITLPVCAVFEVENGRIKAWREYFDLAGLRTSIRGSRSSA
jgi:limonene-1,2-epoxide hydrolase